MCSSDLRKRATLAVDAPAGCSVLIDGAAASAVGTAQPLVGSHWVHVACADHAPWGTRVELTGDQAAFPADSRRMIDALGATDLSTATVRGLHFGAALRDGEPTGNELAAAEIADWLAARYALA